MKNPKSVKKWAVGSPAAARTDKQIHSLPRDSWSGPACWLCFNNSSEIAIVRQPDEQAAPEELRMTRKEFDALVQWYITPITRKAKR